jgi:hypothetical protein
MARVIRETCILAREPYLILSRNPSDTWPDPAARTSAPAYGLSSSSHWYCSHEQLNNKPNYRLSPQCVRSQGSDHILLWVSLRMTRR